MFLSSFVRTWPACLSRPVLVLWSYRGTSYITLYHSVSPEGPPSHKLVHQFVSIFFSQCIHGILNTLAQNQCLRSIQQTVLRLLVSCSGGPLLSLIAAGLKFPRNPKYALFVRETYSLNFLSLLFHRTKKNVGLSTSSILYFESVIPKGDAPSGFFSFQLIIQPFYY